MDTDGTGVGGGWSIETARYVRRNAMSLLLVEVDDQPWPHARGRGRSGGVRSSRRSGWSRGPRRGGLRGRVDCQEGKQVVHWLLKHRHKSLIVSRSQILVLYRRRFSFSDQVRVDRIDHQQHVAWRNETIVVHIQIQ